LFVHRKLANGDIYFLNNRSDHDADVQASFRITGKAPELWYSETGKIAPVSYAIEGGRTGVPLHFEPWGTVFVMFREPTQVKSKVLPKPLEATLTTVDGPWNLSFQPDRGAPPTSKTIQAPANWFAAGGKLWIDLGDVKNLAEVIVNGKSLGIVWHTPYRVDVTKALKPGANDLTVKVINAWVNRLIGDQQPETKVKYTFATIKPYNATSALQASGLLGPVTVVHESVK